jgi:hypothetical protein
MEGKQKYKANKSKRQINMGGDNQSGQIKARHTGPPHSAQARNQKHTNFLREKNKVGEKAKTQTITTTTTCAVRDEFD